MHEVCKIIASPVGRLTLVARASKLAAILWETERIGQATAVRAVGAANGRNPISIIAPCHRVIGASGALTGFAGGLAVKEKLLALEGARWGAADRTTRALFDEGGPGSSARA